MTINLSRNRLRFTCLSVGLLLPTTGSVFADPTLTLPDATRAAASPRLAVPSSELDSSGANVVNPFASGKAVPNSQTLSPPVTVNANTSTDAMTVTQTGTGRAISGVINNTKSTISALKGTTNGSGAALAGQSTGTAGSAGQFQVNNSANAQPALVVSTVGTGNALQAIMGNTGNNNTPAVLGQHTNADNNGYGVGVEGDGGYTGVVGSSNYIGVQGTGYYGVYGFSDANVGVYGKSNTGVAGQFVGDVIVSGTMYAKNYSTSSDRNVKEAIEPVDTENLLDLVAAMPISSWDFMSQPGIRHIGPMAQDFRAAFGLGTDDKHIDLVDGVGVSLAAIQELERRVKSKEARIESLESQLQSLRLAVDARLAALESGAATPTSTSTEINQP